MEKDSTSGVRAENLRQDLRWLDMAIQNEHVCELILDYLGWVVRSEIITLTKSKLAAAIETRAHQSPLFSQCQRVSFARHNFNDVLKIVGNREAH